SGRRVQESQHTGARAPGPGRKALQAQDRRTAVGSVSHEPRRAPVLSDAGSSGSWKGPSPKARSGLRCSAFTYGRLAPFQERSAPARDFSDKQMPFEAAFISFSHPDKGIPAKREASTRPIKLSVDVRNKDYSNDKL